MRIPFPAAVGAINATDYDVLRALHDHGPLWKMEITRRINARRAGETVLDVQDSITKQAVSKRVDRLHELDYVGTAIIAVDEADHATSLNRDLIIGYTLTAKGEDALDHATRHILGDVLRNAMTGGTVPAGVEEYVAHYCTLNGVDRDGTALQDVAAAELDAARTTEGR